MKRWIVLPVVTAMIMAVGLLPSWMLGRAQRYRVIAPSEMMYQNSIRCSGSIYPRYSCQVMASGLYEVEEIYVAMGEQVERGQAVAKVKNVSDQSFYTYENREFEAGRDSSSQLEALARLYGAKGDLTVDESALLAVQSYYLGEDKTDGQLLVTSPISGVISSRLPLAGTVIRSGEALYSVNSSGSWMVVASVSEKQAAEIHLGDSAQVKGDSLRAEEWWGIVTAISPQARKSFNGTGYDTVIDVEITMEEAQERYTSGTSVKASIFTEDARDVLILPYEAVYQDARNREFVLVSAPGGMEPRFVETGAELADGVEIALGLNRGEKVVVVPGYDESLPKIYLLEEGS